MSKLPVHPFADLFPMLPEDELQALADDIKANGLIYPIVRDATGQIIDGRNRQAACDLVEVAPRYEELPDGIEPVEYILAANVRRRHLNAGQRAMAVAQSLIFPGKLRDNSGQRKLAIDQAGTAQSIVSMAVTVSRYCPDLVPQVLAGGSLKDAYFNHAKPAKERQATEQAQRQRLERDHSELYAALYAGSMTLHEALAAANAIDHAIAEAAQLAQLTEAIQLEHEDIVETPLPPPRELPAPPAPSLPRQPNAQQNVAALQEERAFLERLRQAEKEVIALSAVPPLESVLDVQGHVATVLARVAAIVNAAYALWDAHEAAFGVRVDTPLRKVK